MKSLARQFNSKFSNGTPQKVIIGDYIDDCLSLFRDSVVGGERFFFSRDPFVRVATRRSLCRRNESKRLAFFCGIGSHIWSGLFRGFNTGRERLIGGIPIEGGGEERLTDVAVTSKPSPVDVLLTSLEFHSNHPPDSNVDIVSPWKKKYRRLASINTDLLSPSRATHAQSMKCGA